MLTHGILNPHVLSLLARVRHTNAIVIADRGFPSWPGLETVDLSLVDDIPKVLDVVAALRMQATYGEAYMAQEFSAHNTPEIQAKFRKALEGTRLSFEPHVEFKKRVPPAIGVIRTGDTIQYANVILVSA